MTKFDLKGKMVAASRPMNLNIGECNDLIQAVSTEPNGHG